MDFKIVTDSSAELEKEYIQKNNVLVMPIEVIINENVYLDGVDLLKDEFYEMLINNKELPKTSLINTARWIEIFTELCKETNTTSIILPISKELSGSYNAAIQAYNEIGQPKNIVIIDTINVSFGLGAIVMEVVKLSKIAKSVEEMISGVYKLVEKATLLAYIDDLKYLKMGGRLSSTAAAVGGLLKIKPILTISEGKVFVVHKALGIPKACNFIIANTLVNKDNDHPIYFGYAYKKSELEEFKNKYCSSLNLTGNEVTLSIGPTVGTHVGPGAVGLVYFKK